jgi:hypothetical protein
MFNVFLCIHKMLYCTVNRGTAMLEPHRDSVRRRPNNSVLCISICLYENLQCKILLTNKSMAMLIYFRTPSSQGVGTGSSATPTSASARYFSNICLMPNMPSPTNCKPSQRIYWKNVSLNWNTLHTEIWRSPSWISSNFQGTSIAFVNSFIEYTVLYIVQYILLCFVWL